MRGIKISEGLVMAMRTMKMKTISHTRFATSRAELGTISWLYPNDGYPCFPSFVADKVLQLGESPRVMELPLVFSNLRPLPDVGELFQCNACRTLFCLLNDFSAYIVEHPGQDTVFPFANSLEPSFGRTGALKLKLSSYFSIMASYMFSLLTFEIQSRRASSQVFSAHINTDDTNWLCLLNFLLNCQTEINFAAAHIQHNFCFLVFPIQMLPVILADNNGQAKSPPDSADGYPSSIQFESGAMKMERATAEIDELPSCCPITISPSYLSYSVTDQPCWEWACCSDLPVGSAVELVSAKGFRAEGDIGDLVQCSVISLESLKQNKSVIGSSNKFEFQGLPDEHIFILA
jgi:hypothetical protein